MSDLLFVLPGEHLSVDVDLDANDPEKRVRMAALMADIFSEGGIPLRSERPLVPGTVPTSPDVTAYTLQSFANQIGASAVSHWK